MSGRKLLEYKQPEVRETSPAGVPRVLAIVGTIVSATVGPGVSEHGSKTHRRRDAINGTAREEQQHIQRLPPSWIRETNMRRSLLDNTKNNVQ